MSITLICYSLPCIDISNYTLQYLSCLEMSCLTEATQERQGNFSGDGRSRMFLSLQTYKSLEITTFPY